MANYKGYLQDKNENKLLLDAANIIYNDESIDNFFNNYNIGTTREATVAGQYVRLFTFDMSGIWKNTSVLFYLNDTQNNTFSQLVNFSVKKNNTDTELVLHTFKALNFTGDITNQLVAVTTSINRIEVYFKMSASQSPTINILSIAKLNNNNNFGNITIDCNTVVSELPSGTQTFIKNYKSTENQVYSTNEQIIGTWMGKPLYRKVFIVPETTLDSTDTTSINFKINENDVIRNLSGYVTTQTSHYGIPLSYTASPSTGGFWLRKIITNSGQYVQICIRPDAAPEKKILDGNIIMSYTKTTD